MIRNFLVLPVLLAALVAAGCGGSGESGGTGGDELVYSSFGSGSDDVMAETVFKPFTADTGTKVTMDPASENIVAKLRAASQAGDVPWSLIRIEEEDAVVLEKDGLIEPLPADLKQRISSDFGPGSVTDFGIPYIDYSSVLVCNADMVDPCPTNMAEFFDTEHFKGPRTLYADGWLDNLVFALEADGVPPDQIFPLDVDRAFAKLDEIRDSIDVWWTNSDQSEQIFRDGEVAMGTMWSGRAAVLAGEDPNIHPQFEGALLARELWVVPKGAPNPEGAHELMEWYATHPKEVGAYITERHNGIDMPAAYQYVPKEITDALPTAPANQAQEVQVDFDWVTENRDAVYKRWQEWLTQ